MNSPDAVGNIACLLSALKAESILISPFRIKLALMNTAMAPEDGSHHPFSLGAGIIQIYDAFDLLKSETIKAIPTNLADIKVDIEGKRGIKRGIYLREPFEINLPSEFELSVEPTFVDSEDIEERLNFGCPIVLKLSHGSEKDFIKFPKYCQIPSSNFNIHVDPTYLEAGKVYYAQIIGINPENPKLGPLFRIPITVIIPEQITSESDFTYKTELTLEPSIPQRIFLQSPIGCKYVGIKLKSLETHDTQDITVQRLYFDQKNGCNREEFTSLMPPKFHFFPSFTCPSLQTIEFCVIGKWKNQRSTNIKINIKFFGFIVEPTTLMSVNPANKINITNVLSETMVEPTLKFDDFCQPLSPNEAMIESMNERDIIDGSPSFQLLVTYKFYATKYDKYKFKHENAEFYQKCMDSYLIQISTASKKHIHTLDTYGISCMDSYLIQISTASKKHIHTLDIYGISGKLTLQAVKTSSFDIIYLLAAPESKNANSRLEIEANKCDEEKDLKSEIRDIEISYLTKETDSKKAAAIFEKLSSEFPTFLPIYSAEIERLSKLKEYFNLKEMVEKLLEISEIDKVEKYSGVNSKFNEENHLKKEIMEKKKDAIENGLFLQANLALDLFLKSTKKDIPKAFRNALKKEDFNGISKNKGIIAE
uniref:Tripeptidyl peptidase II Ig-like domain-containing protein n=1 Tax=Panagrolaimus sp. PS1159 TaxID=55785 RepID=A0AC35FEU6_9BILA